MSWRDCFTNPIFRLIYAHRFAFGAASAAAMSFEHAYLLHNGAPLWVVFLFIGGVFMISGATALLSVSLQNRLSAAAILGISMLCSVAASLLVAQASWSLSLALAAPIFSGIAMGLYNPIADMFEAKYVHDDDRRGRQYSLGVGCYTLGLGLGAAVGGVLIARYGYIAATLLSTLFYMLSLWPVMRLSQSGHSPDEGTDTQGMVHYLAKRETQPYWFFSFAKQLCIIMKFVLPVFLFILFGDFKETGFIIAGSIVVQMLLLAFTGGVMDRHGHEVGSRRAAWFEAVSCLGFLVVPLSMSTALLLNAAHRIGNTMMSSAVGARLHGLLRAQGMSLRSFGAAWQIMLCAWETVTLAALALLAWLIGTDVFPVIFAAAIVGALLQHYAFPKRPD